ncbi:hypothetical protein SH1V18_08470 [Vallitalea longa]|uniref:HTH tetR-type domain-containing protein n=1 Tax=Vallitalea longa TaxID=2936439 RepID=A0A9W6DEE8_9FIRM|nr:TetR/AcrR family transcriptional regulator [Vallitalea longa]GKX28367.1 hypothetical protein SH1V18_08470 [Vallitalea longa]
MPKIIKDLRENIIKTAINIFNEQGFDAIDMRKIAKDCHIAVGTLYNYFPNKKELMYEVFNRLWYESMNVLDNLIDSSIGNEELFIDYILCLYEEMEKKKGIGFDLLRLEVIEAKDKSVKENLFSYSNFHKRHTEQIDKMIRKSYDLDSISESKLDNLINTVTTLIISNKGADKEYILFLRDLASSYIYKHIL